MKRAIIICGFPGVGKSCAASNRVHILDAESSAFSWIWKMGEPFGKERNPEFPTNYIKHIRNAAKNYDIVLAASHETVREALKSEGIQYVIVAPRRELKNEYLRRYLERGSDIDFIELLNEKWDEFLTSVENDGAPVIWLEKGEYISDVLGVLAK